MFHLKRDHKYIRRQLYNSYIFTYAKISTKKSNNHAKKDETRKNEWMRDNVGINIDLNKFQAIIDRYRC